MLRSIVHKLAVHVNTRNLVRVLLRCFPGLPLDYKVDFDVFNRPHYAYGIHRAAKEAMQLGLDAITAIEFGVAGGNGLVAMEKIAAEVEKSTGILITITGFDTGGGLPPPSDYRDLPHVWREGDYKMDIPLLTSRLNRAELVLGDISQTIAPFLARKGVPPIGFVSFDLDFYSSTVSALKVFDADPSKLLPRVYCYFDDIVGDEWQHHSEHVGELLAIREFNDAHHHRKIAPMHLFRIKRYLPAMWNDMMYLFQDFEHPLATRTILPQPNQQLPLRT